MIRNASITLLTLIGLCSFESAIAQTNDDFSEGVQIRISGPLDEPANAIILNKSVSCKSPYSVEGAFLYLSLWTERVRPGDHFPISIYSPRQPSAGAQVCTSGFPMSNVNCTRAVAGEITIGPAPASGDQSQPSNATGQSPLTVMKSPKLTGHARLELDGGQKLDIDFSAYVCGNRL